jgi:TolB-like protein
MKRWPPPHGWVVLALLALIGCAAPARLYVNPQADLTHYERVAVIPFANLSNQAFAGDRVTRSFITELIMAGRYQVVEPVEFAVVATRMGIEADENGNLDPKRLSQAADSVHATGIIRGAVTEYGIQHLGPDDVAVLAFDAEMIDAATGDVVWRVSISRRGKARIPVIGGGGTRSMGSLTQDACVEAVERLKGRAL